MDSEQIYTTYARGLHVKTGDRCGVRGNGYRKLLSSHATETTHCGVEAERE
tara:strand:+ start:452 stop:604 length:153 start_codon:yes stop_codon:yes gene_type:complete